MMQTLKVSTVLPPAVACRARTAAATPCVVRMGLSSGSRRVSAPMPARRAPVARCILVSCLVADLARNGTDRQNPIYGRDRFKGSCLPLR